MSAESTYLADFDELHILGSTLYQDYLQGRKTKEEVIEQCENIFYHAYLQGYKLAKDDLDISSVEYAYYQDYLDKHPEEISRSVSKKIDGKSFKERVSEHLDNLDGETSLEKVMVTEYHRNSNTGLYDFGKLYGKGIQKKWKTMLDDKVRDTHDYLEGVTIPLEEEFYTFNGNHAYFPSGFGVPEEDINCRCRIQLLKDTKE